MNLESSENDVTDTKGSQISTQDRKNARKQTRGEHSRREQHRGATSKRRDRPSVTPSVGRGKACCVWLTWRTRLLPAKGAALRGSLCENSCAHGPCPLRFCSALPFPCRALREFLVWSGIPRRSACVARFRSLFPHSPKKEERLTHSPLTHLLRRLLSQALPAAHHRHHLGLLSVRGPRPALSHLLLSAPSTSRSCSSEQLGLLEALSLMASCVIVCSRSFLAKHDEHSLNLLAHGLLRRPMPRVHFALLLLQSADPFHDLVQPCIPLCCSASGGVAVQGGVG